MESKEEGVHFSQQKEKESMTFKVRFAQFKQTVGPKEGVAGGSCLKWFNILLSIILLVMGLACLIMGIICLAKYSSPLQYIANAYVNVVVVFIVSGIVMIVAGALSIYCIAKKSYSSLMACLIILAVLIILHFILGGLAFSYRSRADRLSKKAMTEGFEMYFANEHAKEFMDWSQKKFKCCGSKGPADYHVRTHSSTQQTTTHHANTTKSTSHATTTAALPTTKGNKTTTVTPENTTPAQNTTTTVPATTVASTTIAPSTPKAPLTTSPPPLTSTTVEPKTTTQATTTQATTTQAPTTKVTETTTKAKTTVHIIQGMADQNFLQRKSGLPDTCCKETKSSKPCISRPHDIYEHGCYNDVDSYLKKIMCAIGAISFVMIGFELLHLITGALCSKTIKEESGYFKV